MYWIVVKTLPLHNSTRRRDGGQDQYSDIKTPAFDPKSQTAMETSANFAFQGSCHCKAVSFTAKFSAPLSQLRVVSCNCTCDKSGHDIEKRFAKLMNSIQVATVILQEVYLRLWTIWKFKGQSHSRYSSPFYLLVQCYEIWYPVQAGNSWHDDDWHRNIGSQHILSKYSSAESVVRMFTTNRSIPSSDTANVLLTWVHLPILTSQQCYKERASW